jgi:hypothetical protein
MTAPTREPSDKAIKLAYDFHADYPHDLALRMATIYLTQHPLGYHNET